MKFFNNISVAKRLWASSLTALLVLIWAGGISQHLALSAMTSALETVQERDARMALALRWRGLSASATEMVMSKASSKTLLVETVTPRLTAVTAEIDEVQGRIAQAADSALESAALDKAALARRTVLDLTRQIEDARKNGDGHEAMVLMDEQLKPAALSYLALIDDFVAVQERLRDDAKTAALAAALRVKHLGWAAMAAVLALSVAGVAWMVRSITRPLRDAVDAAQTIASGNLTARYHVDRHDELGQLINAIATMSDQLRAIVGEVRQGVESVSMASVEIAHGNQHLAARTEQMAGNLQVTVSSMQQMTSTVSQSADTALSASELAMAAAASAGRGGEAVDRVVASMAHISEGSHRIGEIISTIDGIAFQTNILALNAAVEAARAGEHGRGFAVVAGEVRSLAQRSAEAAKAIKVLINSSVEAVSAGNALAQQTGAAMLEIVSDVRRVSDLIGEICAAAGAQRDGIAQISTAASHLDNVTWQNAALVEESAAAAQSLRQQAQRLASVVQVFKLGAATGPAVRAAAAAARQRKEAHGTPLIAATRS
jgi:methyl-accepting chemotaxis protein